MSARSRKCLKGGPGKIWGVCFNLAFFHLVQSQIEREKRRKKVSTQPLKIARLGLRSEGHRRVRRLWYDYLARLSYKSHISHIVQQVSHIVQQASD
jgi:hypothetical protein